MQDDEEKVIEYYSKVLSKPERSYCVTRKELLAIVKSISTTTDVGENSS